MAHRKKSLCRVTSKWTMEILLEGKVAEHVSGRARKAEAKNEREVVL